MSALGHVWTAPWQELSDVTAALADLLGTLVANLFRVRRQLEVENLFLRHQLNIALRHAQRPKVRGLPGRLS
jgi:hypothetical protein